MLGLFNFIYGFLVKQSADLYFFYFPLFPAGSVGNILLSEIDHEIFSTLFLSLLLIQEGQLSVSGERMCTILVNRLED